MNVGIRKSISTETRLEVRHEGSEAASQEVVCRERGAGRGKAVLALTCTCSDCTQLSGLQSDLRRAFIHRS